MRKILKKKTKSAEKATERENGNQKNDSKEHDSADSSSSEEEYEVQKIVDSKIEKDVCFYLIRWKGYSSDDDTWQAENEIDAPEAIAEFKKRNDKEKKTPKKKDNRKRSANSSDDGTCQEEDESDATENIAEVKKRNDKEKKTPKKKDNRKKSGAADKEEKEWEVAKIIDMVEDDDETGGRVFRIRWKGFAASSDTWEPESNLSCEALIEKYLIDNKSVEPKGLRDNRKTTDRYQPNNLTGRASRRQHGKARKVYYDGE